MSDTLQKKDDKDYGKEFKTKLPVKVIKKDGSMEAFNVQKVSVRLVKVHTVL